MVNSQSQITDDDGSIAVSMESGRYYSITSGLSAVTFDALYDSGANFIARGDQIIEAQRLVSAIIPACLITVGSEQKVYFSTLNSTDVTHQIPLTLKANRIYSVTGGALPPEYFAPSTNGFTVPVAEFTRDGSLAGVWNFLGQTVEVSDNLEICADSGNPAQCTAISQEQLRSPIRYTRETVVRLSKLANLLAKKGVWKGMKGKFSAPFLARGAKIIATMQKMLAPTTRGTVYVCPSPPVAACSYMSLQPFKSTSQRNFGGLFAKPIPKGLESLARRSTTEARQFKTESLDRLPNDVWICPPGIVPTSQ